MFHPYWKNSGCQIRIQDMNQKHICNISAMENWKSRFFSDLFFAFSSAVRIRVVGHKGRM